MNPAVDLALQLTDILGTLTAARKAAEHGDAPVEQRLATLTAEVAGVTGHLSYLVHNEHSPLRQLVSEQPGGAS